MNSHNTLKERNGGISHAFAINVSVFTFGPTTVACCIYPLVCSLAMLLNSQWPFLMHGMAMIPSLTECYMLY